MSRLYRRQKRGDRGAYERYLSGMDASMKQKVALTAAHILAEGTIADMGMGSGTGSEALAALYPALDVIGVDVEPTMVEMATERYQHPNLRFVVGDIAAKVFDDGALDAILNSSVLHHVTSFNGYGKERAGDALRVQVEQLAEDGVLIVRDFVAPEDGVVCLDLPTEGGGGDSGNDPDNVESLSTAALFERFAREYRPLSQSPGFEYEVAPGAEAGWRRYRVDRRHAAEFVLRKDYRGDWSTEILEAYTYYTQREFEALYAELGLRVLTSTPIWNPWIVRHRFRDKFSIRDPDGELEEMPPTNYIIVGEKVAPGSGVRFSEGPSTDVAGFLSLHHYRDTRSGRVMDLVRRPHRTLDILPWWKDDGEVFVLARGSYPRPIIVSRNLDVSCLTGAHSAGYVIEPLLTIQTDRPVAATIEETLAKDAGIEPDSILAFAPGSTYYPSPGGIEEEVRSTFVEIEPRTDAAPLSERSAFASSGRILAIEARQLLRSAQVGALPDARVELNVYDLLLEQVLAVGPWIGDEIELPTETVGVEATSIADVFARPPRRSFATASADESTGFLRLQRSVFREHDARGEVIAEAELEYVVPTPLSHHTIATALLCRIGDEIYIGVDDDDLPAAQAFVGGSDILVAPAWRLPHNVSSITPALAWIRKRLQAEYGLVCGETWELGGRYYPSLGVTPEVVYPVAVEVREQGASDRPLLWLPLDDVIAERRRIVDGHLSTVALRAAHALGRLAA